MRKDISINRNSMPSIWGMPDIEDIFEKALRNPFSLFDEMKGSNLQKNWFSPTVDVEETEHAYLLSVDLPGLKKEEVKVDLSENVLTISGERKRETENKENGGRRYESSYGHFMRSFTLPQSIDASKVEANMEDGVLRVALPKSETSKPRNIEVQSGKGGFFSKLINATKGVGKTETPKDQNH